MGKMLFIMLSIWGRLKPLNWWKGMGRSMIWLMITDKPLCIMLSNPTGWTCSIIFLTWGVICKMLILEARIQSNSPPNIISNSSLIGWLRKELEFHLQNHLLTLSQSCQTTPSQNIKKNRFPNSMFFKFWRKEIIDL